ncbi:MAG TPA: hypothetical protein VES88_13250 [Gemmatimonadaceae bacterium]|nr:hypothetical protein [Gemmatimonadaceae bacterium]
MRVRSGVFMWLSHPDFKTARVALAAGALAGLGVLGACAETPTASDVAGPRAPSSPSNDFVPGVVGALARTVKVCVDINSDAAPTLAGYTFTTVQSATPTPEALDAVTSPVTVAVGECEDVFVRANTGNLILNPGSINPRAKLTITATVPGGYTSDISSCINEGPPAWQDCVTSNTWAISSANIYHGSSVTFLFAQGDLPPLFLILDEDAIDNGPPPNFFSARDVNDDIAKVGQRKQLRWFEANVGEEIVLWSGQMGDEGWFAPKFIPDSWANAGPTDDGLRNFLGLPVGPGLGKGKNPEALLDKIPDVTPLRAEGLFMLIGRTVCAVVYDSDISINYSPLNGSLKGANLGIVAFTVTAVDQLFGQSSGSLPAVTLTIEDADQVCAGDQTLLQLAPVPLTSSTEVDIVPGEDG